MQSYTAIPTSQSLQSSLALLLNNDKTAISCSSGSAFPTANLIVGMLCYRTDQQKLYLLTELTPVWVLLLDLSGSSAAARELAANVFVNAEGANDGAQMILEKPETNTSLMGHVAFDIYQNQVRFWENGGTNRGIYIDLTTCEAGVATKLWHSNNDGAGSGLDADLLDGMQAGNASGNIPISNSTLNTNLNADMLDGKHASNGSGNIPLSNGTVNTNLNADMLDGFHAASFVRSIQGVAPDVNGNVVVDLVSKVSRSGDTMSGQLTNTSGLLHLYGYGGNPNTAVIFMNLAQNRYLHFDGSNYHMPGAELYVNGGQVVRGITLTQGGYRDSGWRGTATDTPPNTARPLGYEVYYESAGVIRLRQYGGYYTNCVCNCNCNCSDS